ncbi:hydroxypyruvate isomerase family protein [Rhodovulum euryhalinum]|uniref:hydroxypyruvate isomerase family protein n=1 Tax=Rhodovulum euryhalinum TaxID=35805 RepID=UPI00104BCD0D|nr:TIM barrel protein [Rhodovulum euryhalinum]
MRFSANLGFLFTEHHLPDAIRAAKAAGFDAVECHFPYDLPAAEVAAALAGTGLPMLSLNTAPGDRAKGEFGLAALPGREAEARAAIGQALDYAAATGTGAVHVLAGVPHGAAGAEESFRANLAFACDRAAPRGIDILIEPLNPRDVPGYHLSGLDHALDIVAALGRDNLKIMFDCYHMQITGGDLLTQFRAAYDAIGHVQFAGVPDRAEPDRGEVDLRWLLSAFAAEGWSHPFGAEYRPRAETSASLGWLSDWRTG